MNLKSSKLKKNCLNIYIVFNFFKDVKMIIKIIKFADEFRRLTLSVFAVLGDLYSACFSQGAFMGDVNN